MAFGGVDANVQIDFGSETPNRTKAAVTDKSTSLVLISLVVFEAFILTYGRTIFRNYHGG